MKWLKTILAALRLAPVIVVIAVCLGGLTFAADAEARWTDGTTAVEGTFTEMAKIAGEKGGTLTMLQDYTYTSETGNAITANKSFTLDLNGKTLTSKSTGVAVTAEADGITTIRNGTIIAARMCVSVKGGGLKMDGVTAWSEMNQNVSYYVTSGKWNTENLIQNCTFANAAWGAFSFNNVDSSMDKTVMAVKNTKLITSKTTAVVIQDKAWHAHLVVGEGVEFYSAAYAVDSDIAVYGEEITEAAGTHTVHVAGHTLDGLTKWITPVTATKEMVIPDVSVPVPISATSGDCGADGDNLTWSLDAAGVLTISGTGAMRDYSYPNYSPWDRNVKIREVVIGDGVTSVGNYAFYGCTALERVTVPGSVTTVGDSAFGFCCKLQEITISSASGASSTDFPQGKKTASYIVADNVKMIGERAFYYCSSLQRVTAAGDGTGIYAAALQYCSGVQNVYYNGTKAQWDQIFGGTGEWLSDAGIHCLKFDVTYNANGGTAASASQIKTLGETLTLSSVVPTREGFEFLGWATTANGEVAYAPGAAYMTDADVTLYAVWEPKTGKITHEVTETEIKITVTNLCAAEVNVYVAAYGESNRMLAVSGTAVAADGEESITLPRTVNMQRCKVFLLDQDGKPLIKAAATDL